MKKRYTITTRVWVWPGDGAWHFVTLPRELFTEIRGRYPRGMVPVVVTIGKTTWDAKLFPFLKDRSYLLAIKKSIRKAEDIWEGDVIRITFRIV